MNLIENFTSALKNVVSHKMRSALTMLGIIIGISSVIMITSIGGGVKNSVFNTISQINSHIIQVMAWNLNSMEDYINYKDVEAIKQIPSVDRVTMTAEWWGIDLRLRKPDTVKNGSFLGVDENYSILETVELAIGRFITEEDVTNHRMVAVITEENAFEVFGYTNCIGEKVQLETWFGTMEFSVVGVLKTPDMNMLSAMLSTPLTRSVVIAPVTTVNDIFDWGEYVDFLAVSVKDGFGTAETSKSITRLLELRHNNTDGYYAESMEQSFDEIDGILSAVTGFVAFVAAISLFVGGVGVMNIMLVTVKERTREIGIRKSLGATNGNILFQFVMEAMILTAIGGVIGIFLGDMTARGIGLLITTLADIQVVPEISVSNMIVAFSVSSIVGIVFGVYPAYKAAKLDPIEALRYE